MSKRWSTKQSRNKQIDFTFIPGSTLAPGAPYTQIKQ